jgi:hypothetical protein
MKRLGSFFAVFTAILFIAPLTVLADPSDPTWAPSIFVPADTVYRVCGPETICFDVSIDEIDVNDTLVLTISGAVDRVDTILTQHYATTVCFSPETKGEYGFFYHIRDKQNHQVYDTNFVTVEFKLPVKVKDRTYSDVLCDGPGWREFNVLYLNPEGGPVSFELISGPGTINQDGRIRYEVTSSGATTWQVAMHGECNSDTGTVIDEVTLNEAPYLLTKDTTISLCAPEEICFLVEGYDPEGLIYDLSQVGGSGTYTSLDSASGRTCFSPEDVDSATYQFIYCVRDYCPNKDATVWPCYNDTVTVTVLINRPPTIICPEPQTFYTCDEQTFCFPIWANDPEFDQLTFNVLSENASVNGDSICVIGSENAEFTVEIEVVDECGNADTCSVPVTIFGNRPPTVTMPADMQLTLCTSEQVCLPNVMVSDPDFDIATLEPNIGSYDPNTNQLCFAADTSGVYTITLTATDSCGASDVDTTIVTVDAPPPPVVDLGGDRNIALCDLDEICLEGITIEADPADMIITLGAFDPETGTICFMPDTSGRYELTVTVSDDCERVISRTIYVDVAINTPPSITGLEDIDEYLCYPHEICFELVISDPDGDIVSITTNRGPLVDGKICFVPYSQGSYPIIVTVTDSCGHVAADTATVNITTDQDITIGVPNDTTVFLCEPDTLCFPVTVPEGVQVSVSGTNVFWNAENNTVCFYSDCCINNTVTVSVTTECGTYSESFKVTVQTNSAPLVTLPQDSSIFACDPLNVCIPVAIGDIDGNLASVTATGSAAFTYDAGAGEICFQADTSGIYDLTVIVTDECGATRSAEMQIDVELNQRPEVFSQPVDTSIELCAIEELCYSFSVGDPNGDPLTVTSNLGEVTDLGEGIQQVCFMPDTLGGTYLVRVTATDDCGASVEFQFTITTLQAPSTSIVCPTIEPIAMCDTATLCFPMEITGSNFVVSSSYGAYHDGSICFLADTAGLYSFEVISTAECNADTCVITVPVDISFPVGVTCGTTDTIKTVCDGPVLLGYPIAISGEPETISVTPEGAYILHDSIFYEATQSGTYHLSVAAGNSCNVDSCGFDVAVHINEPPLLVAGDDTTVTACTFPVHIEVPYHVVTVDNDIVEVRTTLGVVNDSLIRFDANSAGDYMMIVTATDACGEIAKDTVVITVVEGTIVTIDCPTDTLFLSLNPPETIRVPLAITPITAEVSVSGGGSYDSETGELVLPISELGIAEFDIVASTDCNSETCTITIKSQEYFPPFVFCPDVVDTALCLADEVQEVCVPVQISGLVNSVDVSPIGTYADGSVCIPVDTLGEYHIRVIAANDQDADTCMVTLFNTEGASPVVDLGDDVPVDLCEGQEVCVPVSLTPGDFPIASTTVTGGLYDGEQICLTIDTAGVYTVSMAVTDSCGLQAYDEVTITATVNQPPVVSLPSDTGIFLCTDVPAGGYCLPVSVSDVNLESVVPNIGNYVIEGGLLCFETDTAGVYEIILTAADSCGAIAADTAYVTVEQNHAPTVSLTPGDTSVYLCFPREICLDVDLGDIDENIDTVIVSRGTYKNGQLCFVPYGQGDYVVSVTVRDECVEEATATATVHVSTDQNIALNCPEDTTIFLCAPDTICISLDQVTANLPAGVAISVHGTNVTYDPETNTACFYSDCCIQNKLTVTATTECGSYSCSFTVFVQTNSKPLVTLPPDTAITRCGDLDLCIPVGVNDIDGNLMSVTANAPFVYDAGAGNICFTPDTAGIFTIMVTATDSCGAVTVNDMVVTVRDNSAPIVTITADSTSFKQCSFEQICLPIEISDVDDNITEIVMTDSSWTLDPENGLVCLAPTAFGEYCLTVRITDACEASDSATVCITVAPGDSVSIACPEGPTESVQLCAVGTACVPLQISGDGFTVEASLGVWENGQLCFPADTSGLYAINVTAESQCNGDACQIMIPVEILEPAAITCPASIDTFLCGPDTLCAEFTVSSSVTRVTVTGGATINGTTVCIPVLSEGLQTITLIAEGPCDTVSCSFTVAADFNEAPVISNLQDTSLTLCLIGEICLPFSAVDADGNLMSVTASGGATVIDGSVCFTPPNFGTFSIIVTATDECGATDIDTAVVNVSQGASANIECPDDPYVSLCSPGQVCIPVTIMPVSAQITILPAGLNGTYENGQVCVNITQGGAQAVTIIAASPCLTDTCRFTINVDMQEAPVLSCPGTLDTLLCLEEPTQLCFPVSIDQGTGVEINVNPIGAYSAGQVCLPIDTAGRYEIAIIGYGSCGVDTCYTTVTVSADEVPEIMLPEALTVERCPEDVGPICVTGISATDAESAVTITKVCGPGTFSPSLGELCFVPDTLGTYTFCIEATDGCHTVATTYTVDVTLKPDCDVCVRVSFDAGVCTPVGLPKRVALNMETNEEIGGYDLLILYDASALTFTGATNDGADADDWEYFTYSVGNGNCGSACPSGLVRFIGIADINNGSPHPPESAYQPQGSIFFIDFLVANDQNLGDNFVPIGFVWYDCGDNTVSSRTGEILFMDLRILNPEGIMIWDEADDVNYPNASRIFGVGAPDACLGLSDKGEPLRCIEFNNGGVCIIDPEDIDDRGDINLNNLAYEIGDAVIFTSYFIRGISAFNISVAGQIAATDVNADGLTLTVSDLSYLIRVIIGDASPIPRINPHQEALVISTEEFGEQTVVTTESSHSIGVAHLVYEFDPGLTVDKPELAADAANMDLRYAIDGSTLKILVYKFGKEKIEAGRHRLVEIPTSGSGELRLLKAEFADYEGQPYTTASGFAGLPDGFALEQNYPNPFNPTTTISFGLPSAQQWSLRIYNVTGGLVRSFDGANGSAGQVQVMWDGLSSQGEQVASGVYLYRLEAGDYTATKKMMLLK